MATKYQGRKDADSGFLPQMKAQIFENQEINKLQVQMTSQEWRLATLRERAARDALNVPNTATTRKNKQLGGL